LANVGKYRSDRIENLINYYSGFGEDKVWYSNMRMLSVLIMYADTGKKDFRNEDIIGLFHSVFEKDVFTPKEFVAMKVDLVKYAYTYAYLE